ncbi:hypothetical protein NMY22_g8760 [Coprinellus aureogranulatus]|nr:hypothetical protein NMY22_g8760 [Coprinellus aureogranulatus]
MKSLAARTFPSRPQAADQRRTRATAQSRLSNLDHDRLALSTRCTLVPLRSIQLTKLYLTSHLFYQSGKDKLYAYLTAQRHYLVISRLLGALHAVLQFHPVEPVITTSLRLLEDLLSLALSDCAAFPSYLTKHYRSSAPGDTYKSFKPNDTMENKPSTAPGQLGVVQATVPEPVDGQVVIKVEYSTLGPFDLTNLDRQFFVFGYPCVFGLSAAGTVDKVGSEVTDLKVGDRVAALTLPPGSKGLQPYMIQSQSVVAKIPDSLSFEEAVILPDNFVTAYFTPFNQLGLPIPSEWPAKNNPNKDHPKPFFRRRRKAGRWRSHRAHYGLHLFAEYLALIKGIIKPGGKLAHLVPFKADSGRMIGAEGDLLAEVPKEIQDTFSDNVSFFSVKMFLYQEDERLAKTLVPKTLPRFIELGLQPNRVRRVEHADPLTRVQDAFDLLRRNEVAGERLVIKV